MLGQCWQMTLAQCHFVRWAKVDQTLISQLQPCNLCLSWSNIGIVTDGLKVLGQSWPNIVLPTVTVPTIANISRRWPHVVMLSG
jgi:hypothetical protein